MELIIQRFGIPQFLTTDQGAMFIWEDMNYFTADCGMQLIRSTPFYAQVNGQVEASNKVLIEILEKMLEENQEIGTGFYQRHCGPTGLPK